LSTDIKMCHVIGTCTTNGGGRHTKHSKSMQILEIDISWLNDEGYAGELRAYFDETLWDVNEFGFAYTDPAWLNDFKSLLYTLGVTKKALRHISYSEKGMQGPNYVSMDINGEFVKQLDPLLRFTLNLPQLQSITMATDV
jgi:hypothetical protein